MEASMEEDWFPSQAMRVTAHSRDESAQAGDALVKDCIHDEITIPGPILPLLETEPIRRLKRLKQLGVAHLVFSSAEHSRYAHSLGVAHLSYTVAQRLSDKMFVDDRARRLLEPLDPADVAASDVDLLRVFTAGLVHDLGHGPFSHVWEKFLKQRGIQWAHEDMSLQLFKMVVDAVRGDEGVPADHFLRDDGSVQAVIQMVMGDYEDVPPEKAWLYQIVNNRISGLDTDKVDYLLRDQKHTFVEYDMPVSLDAGKMFEKTYVCVVPDGQHTEIAFQCQQVDRVNRVFEGRAKMHAWVYQFGAVLAREQVVIDLLSTVEPVFKWTGCIHHPEKFLRLDDSFVQHCVQWCDLEAAGNEESRCTMRRAQELWKILEGSPCQSALRGWLHVESKSIDFNICNAHKDDWAEFTKQVETQVISELVATLPNMQKQNLRVIFAAVCGGKGVKAPIDKVLFYDGDRAMRGCGNLLQEKAATNSNSVEGLPQRKYFAHLLHWSSRHIHKDTTEMKEVFRAVMLGVLKKELNALRRQQRDGNCPSVLKRPRYAGDDKAGDSRDVQDMSAGDVSSPDSPSLVTEQLGLGSVPSVTG